MCGFSCPTGSFAVSRPRGARGSGMSDGFRGREDERTPMTKDELKRRVWEAVDRRREEIIGVGEQMPRHPGLGFKEVKTARLVEEYGDIEWRVSQARAGKLEFLGGKPELMRLGHFDDVDLAMMIHATSRPEDGKAGVPGSNNGCIVKTVRYIGRAAHAGGAPHMGVNALYAAQIGLMAINAIRETFKDEDTIRVHPIITHGGSQVNVIPGEVRIETYVRGRTVEAILDADKKVDRALRAGAQRTVHFLVGVQDRLDR